MSDLAAMDDSEYEALAVRLLLPIIAARTFGDKAEMDEVRASIDRIAARLWRDNSDAETKAAAARLHTMFDKLFDEIAREIESQKRRT